MKKTTTFQYSGNYTGTYQENGYRNHSIRYEMSTSLENVIPNNVTIKKVEFGISQFTIKKDVDEINLCIYEDDDNDISYSYNKTNTTKNVLDVVPLTEIKTYKGSSQSSISKTDVIFSGLEEQYSYFLNKEKFYIRLVRTDYTESGWLGFQIGKAKNELSITCTVEWDDGIEYKKPSYPTGLNISPSSASLSQGGDSLTFSWSPFSMPAGAGNSITSLSVSYRERNENTWTNLTTNLSPTAISFRTVIPNIIGTYYYVVQALTGNTSYEHTIEELFNGGYFETLTVSNIQKLAPPSNIEHNLDSSYIGSMGCSAFTLSWSSPGNQTNNNVTGYQLASPSSDNFATVGSSTTSYAFNPVNGVLEPGYYGVRARGSAGADYYSDFSRISLTRIASPTIPTIIDNYATTVQSSSFEIQWYPVNSNILGIKRVTYNLYYRYENAQSWTPYTQSPTESTKYSFSTGSFSPNKPFQIGIQAKYEAQGTGYTTSGIASTNYITYHADFTLPSNFWISHSDVANGRNNKKDSHIYNSITLRWNAVNDTSITTNKFNYYVYRAKNNGQYECLNSNSPLSSTNGIAGQILSYQDNNLNGENTLTYYIDVEAIGYAKKVSSAAITVNVVKPIEITLFEVNRTATTKDNIYIRLNWNSYLPDQFDTDEIYADVILWYGNNSSYLEQAMPLAETDRNVPIELDLLLTGTTGAWPSLREAVINQGNPQPQVNLQLILRYGAFSSSAVEASRLVTLNFFTEPNYTNSYLTLTYPSDRNPTYFNPGDTAVVRLSNFVWYNAIGGSEANTPGVTITKYLTSSFSSNTFKFNSSNYAFVPIPAMAEDRNDIVLTLVTTVYYKGADISKDYISSITCNPIIARWIEEPVSINNVQLSEDGAWIEGNLTVPERYCGSDKYENTISIEPILVSPEVTYIFFFDKDDKSVTSFTPSMLKSDNFNKQRIIPFRIFSTTGAETKYSDVTLNFSVNFKNTSNNILTIDNILYRFFTAEVDFAIRKGKIGVNVSKEFGTTDDKTVLEINSTQSSGDAPLVRIATADSFESGTIQYISLMDNSGKQKKIYTKDREVFIEDLHIDMPEIDNTKLLSDDGDLTFSVSNVEGTPATALKLQSKTDSSKNFALVGLEGTLFYQNAFGYPEIITEDNLIDKFSDTSLVDMLNKDAVSVRKGHALVLGNNGVIDTSVITIDQLATLQNINTNKYIQEQLDDKLGKNENAVSATKLATGRSLKVNLASTSLSSAFTGESNITNIGVSGTLAIPNGGTGATKGGAGSDGALNKLGIVYGSEPASTARYEGLIWLKPKPKDGQLDWSGFTWIADGQCSLVREGDINSPPVKYTFVPTNQQGKPEYGDAFYVGKIAVKSFGSFSTMKITATCGVESQYDFAMFTQAGQTFGETLNYSALKSIGLNNISGGDRLKYNFKGVSIDAAKDVTFTYSKQELEGKSIEIAYIRDYSTYNGDTYFTVSFE